MDARGCRRVSSVHNQRRSCAAYVSDLLNDHCLLHTRLMAQLETRLGVKALAAVKLYGLFRYFGDTAIRPHESIDGGHYCGHIILLGTPCRRSQS